MEENDPGGGEYCYRKLFSKGGSVYSQGGLICRKKKYVLNGKRGVERISKRTLKEDGVRKKKKRKLNERKGHEYGVGKRGDVSPWRPTPSREPLQEVTRRKKGKNMFPLQMYIVALGPEKGWGKPKGEGAEEMRKEERFLKKKKSYSCGVGGKGAVQEGPIGKKRGSISGSGPQYEKRGGVYADRLGGVVRRSQSSYWAAAKQE